MTLVESTVATLLEFKNAYQNWQNLNYETKENHLSALLWLISPEEAWLYSLNHLGEFLGFSSAKVREALIQQIGMPIEEIFQFLQSNGVYENRVRKSKGSKTAKHSSKTAQGQVPITRRRRRSSSYNG